MSGVKKPSPLAKGVRSAPGARLRLASIGLEAEFGLVVNERPVKVEKIFGDPRSFVRGTLVHRVGSSYHVPTGGAVYFDTGVIEAATPIIEIERGCAARAGRSLWETILFVRSELDQWEQVTGNTTRLVGFSTHYNVSFQLQRAQQGQRRTVEKLALLLSYILPVPVMVLAANRRSTGVGVRPRGDRIEITADFTPDASLMIATATLVTGIVRQVMRWRSFELSQLDRKRLPVIRGFRPMPHTSRQGWLARSTCFPQNPFSTEIDEPVWRLRNAENEMRSLREVAQQIFRHFWRAVARLSDPFTFRLLQSVLYGRAPSLLELPDRPAAYEDVGRLCRWDNLFPARVLRRSRYERVLINAISGAKLCLNGQHYTPAGMRGWSQVVLRRDEDGTRHVFSIDHLIDHLKDWERV